MEVLSEYIQEFIMAIGVLSSIAFHYKMSRWSDYQYKRATKLDSLSTNVTIKTNSAISQDIKGDSILVSIRERKESKISLIPPFLSVLFFSIIFVSSFCIYELSKALVLFVSVSAIFLVLSVNWIFRVRDYNKILGGAEAGFAEIDAIIQQSKDNNSK